MSPQIGDGATNTAAYWDERYRRAEYPTLQEDNMERYTAAARLQAGDSALDVGCGQAALGVMLLDANPRLSYVGLDYAEEGLRRHYLSTETRDRWAVYCCDWRDAPTLFSQPFSTLYLNEILEHEPDPEGMLDILAPLAAQRIVVTLPIYRALAWHEHRGEHAWDYTPEELEALLSQYGRVGPLGPANARCWVVYVDRRDARGLAYPVMDSEPCP